MEDFYFNKIAHDYHSKRKKPWNALKDFLKILFKSGFSLSGTVLDLGCGNGRNFGLFISPRSRIVGIDVSIELLKITLQRLRNKEFVESNSSHSICLILADMNYLPLRPRSIDLCISIAAIHHIKTFKKRKDVLKDLQWILKINGYLLLTVWRRWQKKYRILFLKDKIKRMQSKKYLKERKGNGLTELGDIYIPWTLSTQKMSFNRFYHLFSKKELLKLLNDLQIDFLVKRGGSANKDNFFVLAKNKL